MTRQYIEDFLESLPVEKRQTALSTMSKYGNNRWWMSDDAVYAARYQLFEDILLLPPDFYLQGVVKLLGRQVFDFEVRWNLESIRHEAKEAIELREKGLWDNLIKTQEWQERAKRRANEKALDYSKHLEEEGIPIIFISESGKVKVSQDEINKKVKNIEKKDS